MKLTGRLDGCSACTVTGLRQISWKGFFVGHMALQKIGYGCMPCNYNEDTPMLKEHHEITSSFPPIGER
jgi:hypothetical protein